MGFGPCGFESRPRHHWKGEIKLIRVWLKVLAGIMLVGFTLFNPGFHQVLKAIIAHVEA